MAGRDNLFLEFPPVSTQEWLDKITIDLKGADFEKKLVWKTNEGFKVKPFYRSEDLKDLPVANALPDRFPYLRGNSKDSNSWFVRQTIHVTDAAHANAKAIEILSKGVDSIEFELEDVKVSDAFIKNLLQGIYPTAIELNYSVAPGSETSFLKILANYYQESGINKEEIRGSLNYDPIKHILQEGGDPTAFTDVATELIHLSKDFPLFRVICINSDLLNNAGAYIYQELGYALAWGAHYLKLLTEAGLQAEEVVSKFAFRFGVSSNYFMEIAKFRAARLLWSDIVNAYGVNSEGCAKMHIHATTTQYNQTLFDSYVNLLRSQTEAMSATLGGIDSMTVTPFDATYESSNELSERLARNQQLLLKEEAHFDKVVDPAGGSYYIENLTASLAQEAWKLFLDVEDKKGFYENVVNGTIQQAVNEVSNKRHLALAQRKETLLGTNQFPDFKEKSDGRKSTAPHCINRGHIPVLNIQREASDFEKTRCNTELSDHTPKVFMLTIGSLSMRLARAQFSCNFLACAGYEVIDNLGFSTVEEGAKAAIESKADIVVLCSSDEEYATYAIPAFNALKDKAIFIVAGNPPCIDELKAAGINYFIHTRSNILDTLNELNEKLGITK